MHPKFTLAILILGISAVAKGQAGLPSSAKTTGKEILTTYQQGHVYDMILVDDKMTSLEVDHKRIEAADFHRYDSIVRAMRMEFKEDKDREDEERAEQKRDIEEEARDREQAVRDRAQADQDRKQAEHDQEQAVRDREEARHDQEEAIRDQQEARQDWVQEEQDRKQAERDREQGERDRQQGQMDKEQGQRDRQQGQRDRQQGERDRQQGERDREQGERDREQGERDRKEAEEERRMIRDLLDDLVAEKIAPDVKSINSVVLTDTELVVNDKKQSPQLQQKIKGKYAKWAKCGVSYGCCQTSGTTIQIGR